MIAFDTDVLSLIHAGNATFVQRADALADRDHAVPVVVLQELIRGRLNAIRLVEAGRAKFDLEWAYRQFEITLAIPQTLTVLSFTASADARVAQWKSEAIRIGTNDLRIAAICVEHNATLITRNQRDFERLPNLQVEFWN